jgi:hypothetical protein
MVRCHRFHAGQLDSPGDVPAHVDRKVVCDAEQPRAEVLDPMSAVQVAIKLQEDFLCEVLGLGWITPNRQQVAVNGITQLFERAANLRGEIGVGHR